MDIQIEETGTLSYCLKVEASAEDLEPDIDRAVREHRAQLQVKGFRTGRVPVTLVRSLYGAKLAQEVVRSLLEEVFEDLVLKSGKYRVWEDSVQYEYDYEYGKQLKARITFAERPRFKLPSPAGQEIRFPTLKVTAEDVDKALEEILWNYGEVQPVNEGADIEEGDILTYDLQEIDPELNSPIVGTAKRDQELRLGEEGNALEAALRVAALDAQAGSVVRFEVGSDEWEAGLDPTRCRSYEARLTAVRRRQAADLTDELVRRVTRGQMPSTENFWEWVGGLVEDRLTPSHEDRCQECTAEVLLDLYAFEAPQLVIDRILDSVLQQEIARGAVDASAEGSPEDLRMRYWTVAERSARWIFLREALLIRHAIDFTHMDAYLVRAEVANQDMADCMYMNREMGEVKRRECMDPERVQNRILNRKLFDEMIGLFHVTYDDPEIP